MAKSKNIVTMAIGMVLLSTGSMGAVLITFNWFCENLWLLFCNSADLITFIVGAMSIAALVLFVKIMPKRTPYGNEIFGKIKGFKKSLEVAKQPQLEELVSENPEYFFEVLSYTYALKLSNQWAKKFENIDMETPDWYDGSGNGSFDLNSFNALLNSTDVSSDSSYSGGGYSAGGGAGGGGMGSW